MDYCYYHCYYITNEVIIEYQDKYGNLSTIYTNLSLKKRYVYEPPDYLSNDDIDTKTIKLNNELERKIQKNKYKRILYENDKWIKKSYKKKYQDLFIKSSREICKLLKIYKRVESWKN